MADLNALIAEKEKAETGIASAAEPGVWAEKVRPRLPSPAQTTIL